MDLDKLVKRIQGNIDFSLDNEEDLNAANWNYQEGILITVNEAICILDLLKNSTNQIEEGRKEATDEIRQWLIEMDYEGIAERI